MAETIKVFITKYALTDGIREVEVETTSSPSMVVSRFGFHRYFHGEGREWHRTRESAVARAEELRTAKLDSLRKSIAKFEALRFE